MHDTHFKHPAVARLTHMFGFLFPLFTGHMSPKHMYILLHWVPDKRQTQVDMRASPLLRVAGMKKTMQRTGHYASQAGILTQCTAPCREHCLASIMRLAHIVFDVRFAWNLRVLVIPSSARRRRIQLRPMCNRIATWKLARGTQACTLQSVRQDYATAKI